MNGTAAPLKLKNPVSSLTLSEAVKEYDLPSAHTTDGVRVHASPVVLIDPHTSPIRPTVAWGDLPVQTAVTADPAAGANPAAFGPPAGRMWRVVGMIVQAVTSAVAGNRRPQVVYINAAGVVMLAAGGAGAQVASTTVNHAPGIGVAAPTVIAIDPAYTCFPLPDIPIMPGQTVQFRLGAIDGGDDLGPVTFSYQEIEI